jgi:hypothetical protein
MASDWTLPLLQETLDDLPVWSEFRLPKPWMVTLFGLDDVAAGRIARFARSHSCAIMFDPAGVTFRKCAR